MSSQKGNLSRSRPQKHKNAVAFKNTLYDRTPQTIKIVNKNIVNVCARCKQILDWKIKYKKYKMLSKPANCTKCNQRNVLEAYHTMCQGCAKNLRVCPKCGKSATLVKDIKPEEGSDKSGDEEGEETDTKNLSAGLKKLSVKDKKKKKSKKEEDFDSSDFGSSDFDSDFD